MRKALNSLYHAPMTGLHKLTTAAYWLALTLWVGSILAVGVTAVSTFGVLPDPELGLTLERFDAYDHAEHGRIAAGLVNEPAFTFVDVVQVGAGAIVLLTLILQLTLFRMPWYRPANIVRVVSIVIAAGLLAARMVMITPEMNRELRAYWNAAEAGDVEAAHVHREAFDRGHAIARPMFDFTMPLLLIAVAASGIAHVGAGRGGKQRRASLEEPALVR